MCCVSGAYVSTKIILSALATLGRVSQVEIRLTTAIKGSS